MNDLHCKKVTAAATAPKEIHEQDPLNPAVDCAVAEETFTGVAAFTM
jgi:hypothetical protein